MLRVTVSLVPWGEESLSRTIGELEIINDGTGGHIEGNYKWKLKADSRKVLLAGTVKGHKRADGFWPLVRECLNQAELDVEK